MLQRSRNKFVALHCCEESFIFIRATILRFFHRLLPWEESEWNKSRINWNVLENERKAVNTRHTLSGNDEAAFISLEPTLLAYRLWGWRERHKWNGKFILKPHKNLESFLFSLAPTRNKKRKLSEDRSFLASGENFYSSLFAPAHPSLDKIENKRDGSRTRKQNCFHLSGRDCELRLKKVSQDWGIPWCFLFTQNLERNLWRDFLPIPSNEGDGNLWSFPLCATF